MTAFRSDSARIFENRRFRFQILSNCRLQMRMAGEELIEELVGTRTTFQQETTERTEKKSFSSVFSVCSCSDPIAGAEVFRQRTGLSTDFADFRRLRSGPL